MLFQKPNTLTFESYYKKIKNPLVSKCFSNPWYSELQISVVGYLNTLALFLA